MRKVIAAFNMTLDGICDHTTGIADESLHEHYANLIQSGDVILYGRKTYQLMQFWQTQLEHPSGEKLMDDFAASINQIEKLVFSHSLHTTDWETATFAKRPLEEEVLNLKQQAGKHILVGSRSLIIQLLNRDLIDEFQICIHPVIEGKGMQLFDEIAKQIMLQLIKTKPLASGAIVCCYRPKRAHAEKD